MEWILHTIESNNINADYYGSLKEVIMNWQKVIVFCTIFFVFTVIAGPGYCEVLFQDNFDSHPDWSPNQRTMSQGSYECWGASCLTTPAEYIGYRVGKSSFIPVGHNTINIDSSQHRGPTGKAFVLWSESATNPSWPSDGLLCVLLEKGYPELYVRFYIKFQSNWQWKAAASSQQKFFRISHYRNSGGNPFGMKAEQHPMFIADLRKGHSGQADISYYVSFRYETSYYPNEATPSHASTTEAWFGTGNYGGTGTDFWDDGMMGDGEWHCWEFYVKINSAIGVEDGIHRFWQDGVLISETTDLAWGDNGSRANPRRLWNSVMLGGNNFNAFAPAAEKKEQWYAIDDLVISTESIGPLPSAPKNLRMKQ